MSNPIKTIMLVEDDPSIIDIYQTVMKKAQFEVTSVTLGADAIARVKAMVAGEQVKPDLVLLDMILPDMNGSQILKEIRSHEETKHLRVFILTNQGENELDGLKDLHPDKFLIKANTTPAQLVELIKNQ